MSLEPPTNNTEQHSSTTSGYKSKLFWEKLWYQRIRPSLGIKTAFAIFVLFNIFLAGMVMPEQQLNIPVQNASKYDWNHQSFWHWPWGRSGVHKGIDIFSKKGTPVLASTDGIVIYAGEKSLGGHTVAILGPKWRIYYYAHLNEINTSLGAIVKAKETIGTVGNSGNAKKKAPHLHYSITSLMPYVDQWDDSREGWKKMFYMDPTELLLTKRQRDTHVAHRN